MAKSCDNKSVGILLRNGTDIVFIERFNYPEAYALPAGHCDGNSFEQTSLKEAGEEVGVHIIKQKLLWNGTIDNPCKRDGGTFHKWALYEALEWTGELKAGSDAKRFFLVSVEALRKYAKRTEYFMEKYSIPFNEVGKLTVAVFGDPQNQNTDSEWKQNPGLEPVWYFMLKQLSII